MYRFIELHDPEPKYYYGIGEAVDLYYELKTEVNEDQELYQVELLAQHSKGRVDEGTFPEHLEGDVTGNERIITSCQRQTTQKTMASFSIEDQSQMLTWNSEIERKSRDRKALLL